MRRIFYFQATLIWPAIKSTIDNFLDYLSYQKRYSGHTVTAYRNDLYRFADFLETQFEIDDLTDVKRRQVSSFVAALSEEGLKPRSINRKLSAVQSLFEYLLRQGELVANPAKNIQRPKTGTALPSVLRKDAIEILFEGTGMDEGFEGARDRLMLHYLNACGLRREELINLGVDDLDTGEQHLKVTGKRNKQRLVPVAPMLIELTQDYLALRSDLNPVDTALFLTNKGKKLYPSLVYQVVKNYLSTVTSMEKKSPHVLRHTFATHLLNEGANLQSIKELLGHSSLAATQVYTHTSLDKLKDVYNKSHPRNKK